MPNHNTPKKQRQDTESTKPYEIRVSKRDCYTPPWYRTAKIVKAGDFRTMRYIDRDVINHAKKISKTQYKHWKTGEVFDSMPTTPEQKAKIKKSTLNRTFEDLRAIIRANFCAESHNQLFITLTYDPKKKAVKDGKILYEDFKKFMKRLEYAYKDKHSFEWVAVMEPNGLDIWHVHLMIKSTTQEVLFIDNRDIERIWRYGYTDTQRLKSDDVGNYYTAYFTDLVKGSTLTADEVDILGCEPDNGEDIYKAEQEIAKRELTKAQTKGGRLHLYPPYFKFFRCSRGITRPEKYTDIVYDLENDSQLKKTQSNTYDINKVYIRSTDDAEIGEIVKLNTIHKATYRKRNPLDKTEDKPTEKLTKGNIVLVAKAQIMEQLQIGGQEKNV